MSIINPKGLYSAGSVVLNSQSEVNAYAQMMAKQQAKKDALDQYYTKQLGDVTDQGMRNKDVLGGWAQKLNDWETKYMNPEKRKYLRDPRLDNYKTVTEFNQEHQDLLRDAQLSKQEAADEAKIWQLQKEGKMSNTDEDMDIRHRKGLSIYDPQRKDAMGNEPDLMKLSFTHQWNPEDEAKLYKSVFYPNSKDNRSELQDDTRQPIIDNQKMTIQSPIIKVFPKDAIAQNAMHFDMIAPPEARSYYQKLMQDPAYYKAMSDAFKTVHGEDAVLDAQHATEAAGILNALRDKSITYSAEKPNIKLRTDTNLANSLTKMSVQDQYTMKHIAYSWGFRMQAGINLEENADNAIAADQEYAAKNGGKIESTPQKKEILFGTKSGEMRFNKDGSYELVKNPGTPKEVIIGTKTPDEAKDAIMKYKAPVFKPGVGDHGQKHPSTSPNNRPPLSAFDKNKH